MNATIEHPRGYLCEASANKQIKRALPGLPNPSVRLSYICPLFVFKGVFIKSKHSPFGIVSWVAIYIIVT